MTQASFTLQGHNPDVLSCIANLSNDEVFTPPAFANEMLDTLETSWAASNNGESIWANKDVTFLDPCTKSGVFLREIVKRLNEGLSKELPNLTERIDHILTKQVFGIGITELTSLLARRSVYCSKYANGVHSVARAFTNNDGNVWFERTEHTWVNGKCKFCSASKAEYGRGGLLETHAYKLIHTEEPKTEIGHLFGENMHFDVIIGNPPYQLSDGGAAASAIPIYHRFVEQAKKLEPRFMTMVLPARWFVGGRGLDNFRESMLNDRRIRKIIDFPDSGDVFPGTQIKGGVCYFLWDRDNAGEVEVATKQDNQYPSIETRELLEPGADVFIRYNQGVHILRKVMALDGELESGSYSCSLQDGKAFTSLVSSGRPFGFRTYFKGRANSRKNDVMIYQNGGTGYVSRTEVAVGIELIDCWKVFISAAYGAGDQFPHSILGIPFVGAPGEVSTETYLCIGPFRNKIEAENVCRYISTKFVRFLVLLHKPTQHATKNVYKFVSLQDFTKTWTDELLFKKYGITKCEVDFIDSMVRPMELDSE
jgi:site-specific DNA-methyltransferase (adenine-specific)